MFETLFKTMFSPLKKKEKKEGLKLQLSVPLRVSLMTTLMTMLMVTLMSSQTVWHRRPKTVGKTTDTPRHWHKEAVCMHSVSNTGMNTITITIKPWHSHAKSSTKMFQCWRVNWNYSSLSFTVVRASSPSSALPAEKKHQSDNYATWRSVKLS